MRWTIPERFLWMTEACGKYIHAPWTLPPIDQKLAGCVIGTDYPAPIVDHAKARELTLARFGVVKGATE